MNDTIELPEELSKLEIDIGPLRMICEDYMDAVSTNKYVDDDLEHYIFECAMETLYGGDVWDYINSKLK